MPKEKSSDSAPRLFTGPLAVLDLGCGGLSMLPVLLEQLPGRAMCELLFLLPCFVLEVIKGRNCDCFP